MLEPGKTELVPTGTYAVTLEDLDPVDLRLCPEHAEVEAGVEVCGEPRLARPDNGEPVGDRLMFFSDGLPVQLPHSGLFFLPAVVRMDYENGCREYTDCFAGIVEEGRPTAVSLLVLPPDLERLPIAVKTKCSRPSSPPASAPSRPFRLASSAPLR